ncbi:MAG: glucose-1-phosphate thymidylyltransferase [Candidatus Magasanikbacteria bacterium RIFCSPHIGHO2_01_FULL_33_34]|uniref:glucose-1-phosphate thymidylyltransferase n=1 Tax=Candidatus Magasanikbacteria bacterium RIFCSPHIGHO2_01_FULL_33_34 TaxID=1798671 RepID=A0A1F6LL26_9BACT|nr:MAG: glucose-1-phosphate thymidylyltransferase [Candidatus Magasanikbacteria bacterium RIFCSPHIGHO2_01_FULL_33_34]OGH65791.1 MAG: glucose-1-phosphate thymidylyltransferase [Candidatus Magasanikbacteria bacterium RIFCSPHIGHO2_02_FULL_33_17]OGH75156.1 MAG: glucose-1-phosphate thymidylyltransferase [Candidatus Magasanikbacteria bacterium RIFCSPLOWO2_01_FULL_33_34]OGH81544.1 MAG: glucose-1-phosphate thymidylyltransferase [Candidatus Magasanikbacteria bacterium RIFCSPLOWO2_12_FULL_34_7]
MITKAILTGGGRATRLYPITSTINKHLLPLANKPMIFHAIEKVVDAGIKEIFINVNPGEEDLQKHIGDGGHWGVKIKFFEQTGGPQGIAHVVNEAKKFIGDDPFVFYLSDNILFGDVKEMIEEFNKGEHDCMLALSEVPDPNRFGVPVFDNVGNLIDVIEKPEVAPNNFAVTGIYLYGPKIFFEAFDNIEKSARGEYEISSIHSYFLKNNKKVGYKEITGWWKDTGKTEDLLLANRLLLEKTNNIIQVSPSCVYDDTVELIAPVIIGENCILKNCKIGPYVTIGQGSIIKNANIEDSILLSNVEIDCQITISDSLIGKGVKFLKKEERNKKHKLIVGDKTVIEF